ncbi:MAG: hypothetical protein AAFV80_19145, partial [Bacteroidota bacterium]
MIKSKLFQLFQTLDRGELRDLSKFLVSDYLNDRKAVIPLFNYLKRLHPDFPPPLLEKKIVYQQLFPEASFNAQHLGHLMNYLLKSIQEFLIINKLKEDTRQKDYYLLAALREKNLHKHFEFENRKVTFGLQSESLQDAPFHFQAYRIAELNALAFSEKQPLLFNPYLQALSNNLDRFYLTEKMKYISVMLNNQEYTKDTYEISMIDNLIHQLEKLDFSNEPSLEIYQLTIQLIRDQDTQIAYPRLKELFQIQPYPLPKGEMRNKLYFAFNFANKEIRKG